MRFFDMTKLKKKTNLHHIQYKQLFNYTHFRLLDQIFAGKIRILHWFSMNCHLGDKEKWKKSKTFTCIPQGISQWLDQHSIDQWRYYLHIARSKYVLSPPGNGMDCYRTWEALYIGSIPTVMNTSINSIFQQLPVLIINNYEDLTFRLLKDFYNTTIYQKYDHRRLYIRYWQNQINSFRNSSQPIRIHYTSLKD
ncbi:unnamed protein product [Adineta steineri]|uniref:RXYLT1 C-terminal domain-containing protein n=1 Tax=Adineta steineri TaxID=433720 RepID=A0A813PIC5_9BILA|nr:unnamed protein product [Adineta steineri]CAF0753857.1 unnamed protein product [Adineta steineri]CAF0833944.1 unnamed protein product [Adineta steineri]